MDNNVKDLFRVRDYVPEFERLTREFVAATEEAGRRWRVQSNVPYGPHPDQRLDLYFPNSETDKCPVHLFVHGGYWRAFRKEDFGFVANTVCAVGGVAAIVDYSLMPLARMSVLVRQVRESLVWIGRNAASFGGDASKLSASGHSAGAHLASWLFEQERVDGPPKIELPPLQAVILVSGLYDLEPISQSFLQPEITLTPEEIAEWTPLHGHPDARPSVRLCVGEHETPPFHQQMRAFEQHLRQHHVTAQAGALSGHDHLTIVRDMGRPGSEVGALLEACVKHVSS
jgi:arylformamidase